MKVQDRFSRFAVSPELLVAVAIAGVPPGIYVVENPLPKDAEYQWAYRDPAAGLVWIVISSESFAPVQSWALIPSCPQPTFKRRDLVSEIRALSVAVPDRMALQAHPVEQAAGDHMDGWNAAISAVLRLFNEHE